MYDRLENLIGMDLRRKKVVFSLGRPVKRKGFDRFVRDVFPHLPDDVVYIVAGPSVHPPTWLDTASWMLGPNGRHRVMVAAGYYSCHEDLIALSTHPRVIYLNGVSEEVRNMLFAVTDVMVVPNVRVDGDMEGFGIVALEAAVRGIPVVGSRLEGITDAIVDGENGYLVDADDNAAMARVVTDLLNDRERLHELGARAKDYTRRTFAVEQVTGQYIELFEELFREGKHGADCR